MQKTSSSRSRAPTGVKIFSATVHSQRQALGEDVTAWLAEARVQRQGFRIVDIEVRQTSDHAFHCVTICVLYNEESPEAKIPHGALPRG